MRARLLCLERYINLWTSRWNTVVSESSVCCVMLESFVTWSDLWPSSQWFIWRTRLQWGNWSYHIHPHHSGGRGGATKMFLISISLTSLHIMLKNSFDMRRKPDKSLGGIFNWGWRNHIILEIKLWRHIKELVFSARYKICYIDYESHL